MALINLSDGMLKETEGDGNLASCLPAATWSLRKRKRGQSYELPQVSTDIPH